MTFLPTIFSDFDESCLKSFANPKSVKNGQEVCGVVISPDQTYQKRFSNLYNTLVGLYVNYLFAKEIKDTLTYAGRNYKWFDEKQKREFEEWKKLIAEKTKRIREKKGWNELQIAEHLISKAEEGIREVSQALVKFLEDAEFQPNFKEPKFTGWIKEPLRFGVLDSGGKEKGNIYLATLSKKKTDRGDIEFFYLDEDIGEKVEQIFEIEDEGERRKAIEELKRYVIEKILEEVIALPNIDEEVRKFFKQSLEIYRLGENNPIAKEAAKRLIKIQVDITTGYVEEIENEDEGIFQVFKPILTKLGYGNPTSGVNDLSYEEVLKRIATNREVMKVLGITSYSDQDELKETIEEIEAKLEKLGAVELLKKLYGKEKEKFLAKVRNSLVKLIDGSSKKIKSVKFIREKKPLYKLKSVGVESPYHGIAVVYEKGIGKEEIYKLIGAMRRAKANYLNIGGNLAVSQILVEMEKVFPYWQELKGSRERDKKANLIEGERGKKVLATLIEFTAFMEALRIIGDREGLEKLPFFLLNVENSNDYYSYWNAFRALMEAINYPSQTLTRKMLRDLVQNKAISSLLKNTYLSALRGEKRLIIELEDLNERLNEGTYYLLIENGSKAIRKGEDIVASEEYRHYLYKTLRVEIRKKSGGMYRISLKEEKSFFLLSNGIRGDREELVKFLQETRQPIIVISPYLKGFMKNILSKPAEGDRYFALYKLSNTIYRNISKRVERDTKNAFIIYESDFTKGLRRIGFSLSASEDELGDDSTLIAIRSPKVIPDHLKDYPYFSYTLNLFFVKGLKGKNPQEEASLLFSLFSWLIYENEAWTFFYSKPKFIPLKLPKVSFSRKFKVGEEKLERKVVVPLNLVVFELAYLFTRWKEENSVLF
jgi:hypothetical protein